MDQVHPPSLESATWISRPGWTSLHATNTEPDGPAPTAGCQAPGKGLSETRAAYYRNQLLGFVFQSFNLIPFKTALENVALPLYYQKVSRRKRNRIAMEYLDKVNLVDWAGHLPGELSGGQQQRVAIARSLITRPKVILADEPTGALDSQTSLEVIEILRAVNREGTTVVLVTHEHDISEMTDRVIHLLDGVIGHEQTNGGGPKPAVAGDGPEARAGGGD